MQGSWNFKPPPQPGSLGSSHLHVVGFQEEKLAPTSLMPSLSPPRKLRAESLQPGGQNGEHQEAVPWLKAEKAHPSVVRTTAVGGSGRLKKSRQGLGF